MISTVPPRQSLKTRITLTTLAIFLVSLWSLSYYASQMLHKDMEHLMGEQQFSTVSYVAAQLNHDLDDRLEALKAVAATFSPAILGNTAATQALLEQRPIFQRLFNAGIFVTGLDGTATASIPLSAGRLGVNYMDIDTIAAALKEGKSTIGRPVVGKKSLAPVFGMTVPIRDTQGHVIGALTGATNLGKPNFLDRISNNHYGKNGGYLLVAPQHRLVVTASDKSRIMDRIPDPGTNPLIDQFVQGHEGTSVLVNPLGVEVLSSAKGVPVAGWYVAASLPTADAFAPIHAMLRRMLLATIFLTLLAGILTWWMLKRQLAPMLAAAGTLATMSDSRQPPQPLPITRHDEIGELIGGFNRLLETLAQRDEALRQSEAQNQILVSVIPDLIFTNRRDGEYLAVHATDPGMLFVSPDIFLHRKVEEVLPRPVADLFMKAFSDALDSNSMLELNYSLPMGGEERQFEARVVPSTEDTVISIVRDVTERKQAEAELRIAAIAFECQEGMIVTDAKQVILRTNQSFTRIMGYTNEEVVGKTTAFMRSDRHPAAFYDAAWDTARRDGSWHAEVWHKRKNGEVFQQWLTSTAVKDEHGDITHYVVTHIDITSQKQQEAKRLADEAAHRDTLVREVHHRIKNNLQGITGLLRQFAQKHPETADPINQAIGQVRGISVIHGLQGRAATSSVRLCELTGEIALEIQNLWQTTVTLDIPPMWIPFIIAEKEAVPIALVLNELIVNAVKHGDKASGTVNITLRKGPAPDVVHVKITNTGQLSTDGRPTGAPRNGLQLIAAMMPRNGASIVREQHDDRVITLLELQTPVISLELKEPT